LKRVELTRFKKFGVKVATDLETAVEFLRFAQAVMMKRYERMEELGVNDFEDLPEKLQALMVMIDEAGELLSPTGAKALSENTVIPMADKTYKLMKDLLVGDEILDNYGQPTTVTQKYEPVSQKHYKLNISSQSGESEQFIAGEEHYWVVYFEDNKGNLDGPHLKETGELKAAIDLENLKDKSERRKIKIKKN
jgi:hypothetical protein